MAEGELGGRAEMSGKHDLGAIDCMSLCRMGTPCIALCDVA